MPRRGPWLVAGSKTRGYTRYSLLLFPLLFCLIGRCSRRWSPGAEVPVADHRNVKIPDDQDQE